MRKSRWRVAICSTAVADQSKFEPRRTVAQLKPRVAAGDRGFSIDVAPLCSTSMRSGLPRSL
jgi:hypothetical protein